MSSEAVQEKLDHLPRRPGVYRFLDGRGEILYVGKAKSLRARVRSYFQPSARHPPRTANLVEEVEDLEVIVVDTELEALLLESNLIKKHRPRYNVILRDDKHYPYLMLSTSDEYPRLSLVRKARLDGNQYYGPFTPASVARRSLKLVPKYFQVATCNEVFDGKRRPCLYYHLDQCLAPCAGNTDPEEYGKAVSDARLFLEGRHRDLERSLESRMKRASDGQAYERAARYRDTLQTVRRVSEKQSIASVGLENQDYFAHYREAKEAVLQVFQVREGKVQGRREFGITDADVPEATLYATALMQYYLDQPPPREVVTAVEPEDAATIEAWLRAQREGAVRLHVPHRGAKRRFLELVRKNAVVAFENRFRSRHAHGVAALEELARHLGLDEPPMRIECFDVSNIQGADSVASLVVWQAGKPKKSDYRLFGIRSVAGPDDFASIAEAVTRRYRRVLAEERRMPDLVLIDGGPGQRSAAVRALAVAGIPTLTVIGLAKREEEIWLEPGTAPIRLPRTSEALRLVQRIRDEAHRFAIEGHRRKRARRTLRTGLTDIPGVGPVLARRLLRAFGSLKGVRAASEGEIAGVVGPKTAVAVMRHFEGSRGRSA